MKSRKSQILACASALALASCGGGSDGGARAPVAPDGVTHVRIEGELDAGTLGHLKRAVREAQGAHHDRLVVEIDTPGGEIELLWQLSKLLRDAASNGVAPVAWVHDRAWSAGVLVALSCDRIYMTPQGSIGSALPVQRGPMGITALPSEGEVRAKVISAVRANFRAMAEKTGRPPALAEAMVDPDAGAYQVRDGGTLRVISAQQWADARAGGSPPELVRTLARPGEILNLSAAQAVELGFADGLADDLPQVLDKIGESAAPLAHVARARSDDWVAWLDRWWPLILGAALVLAYIEIQAHGFGIAGFLSIACFAVLLVGRYLTGLADVLDVVMVVLGIALIALEIFVAPGTLWFGLVGALLVIAGFVLGSVGPGFEWQNALDQRLAIDAGFRFMLAAVLAVAAGLTLSRFLPKTPVLRGLVLDPSAGATSPAFAGALPEAHDAQQGGARVGAVGVALTALRPVGKVRLDADLAREFEARAGGRLIERGERVRVIEVSAGRLVVESAEQELAG
jgi:membrane-bound serine protease (ClpP class)